MSNGYSMGDGAGLMKHLVHSVTDPVASHGQKVTKQRKKDAVQAEAHQRQEHFVKGQQDHEVALLGKAHEHHMAVKQSDHEHEASMLKLAHTMHRNTVRSERKAGVVEGNTTFSTSTVQANGGHRRFGEPEAHSASASPAPATAKPATPKSPTSRATKPVTIGAKKPRATKAQQKPAGSTGITFQAP